MTCGCAHTRARTRARAHARTLAGVNQDFGLLVDVPVMVGSCSRFTQMAGVVRLTVCRCAGMVHVHYADGKCGSCVVCRWQAW
jgi:hypothetical protein